ncbi:hypothetical protein B0H14DRAFT_2935401 [Mycena olivaceomarginata]|nr:hypothetical protein B0H14DRAFT_2935401 [Mycena olivaceomarginata]
MRTSLRGSYHTEHWCGGCGAGKVRALLFSSLLSTPTISFRSSFKLRDLWVIFSTYPNKSPQASPRVGCARYGHSQPGPSMLWPTTLQRTPKSLSPQTKLYLLGPGNIASASTTLKTPVASKDSRIQAQVTMHRWNRLMTHSTMRHRVVTRL